MGTIPRINPPPEPYQTATKAQYKHKQARLTQNTSEPLHICRKHFCYLLLPCKTQTETGEAISLNPKP